MCNQETPIQCTTYNVRHTMYAIQCTAYYVRHTMYDTHVRRTMQMGHIVQIRVNIDLNMISEFPARVITISRTDTNRTLISAPLSIASSCPLTSISGCLNTSGSAGLRPNTHLLCGTKLLTD